MPFFTLASANSTTCAPACTPPFGVLCYNERARLREAAASTVAQPVTNRIRLGSPGVTLGCMAAAWAETLALVHLSTPLEAMRPALE